MISLIPPQIIPLTDAPSQIVNVTLGGQVCQINVYTKSINRPIQPPGDIPVVPIQAATLNGQVLGNTLTITDISGGEVGIGYGIFLADNTVIPQLPGGIKIRGFLTGTGGVGTYTVFPGTIPINSAGQYDPTGVAPLISGSMVAFTTSGPTYENTNPVFLDLLVNDAPIISGVILKNESLVVMDTYLGFIGDLAIIDTSGQNEDPFGVPQTLPNPPDLRNWWQRNVPLSLGGKAPPGVAGRIPGLGTRYLLTYWPNLR